jgi:uncharacterized pyridoxal phosphate-containing UPF0001 family protein
LSNNLRSSFYFYKIINYDAHRQQTLLNVIIQRILDRENKKAEARETQQQRPVSSAAPVIHQAPTIVYQGAQTITAMQVRKEKEAELFANDQYWANRLKNQEAEFLKNSKIMEKEFTDTVSSVFVIVV